MLVTDYFIEDRFKKFSCKLDSLKETLNIYTAEERKNRVILEDLRLKTTLSSDKRSLLSELSVVFNLRFIEGNSEETIKQAIKYSEVDIKLFTAMHYGEMVENKICLVSLLVLKDMSGEDLRNVKICSGCLPQLVITKEDLLDENNLTTRINKLTEAVKKSRSHGNPPQVNPKELFLSLASNICGALSINQVQLPNGSKNSLQGIYLNEDQQDFLRTKDKHIILTGSYGTGKSVLAQLKFQELILSSDENKYVYFLCWSEKTAFEGMMKKCLTDENRIDTSQKAKAKVMSVNEYAKEYKLQQKPVKFSHVLKDIRIRHGNCGDVIVDEFDVAT